METTLAIINDRLDRVDGELDIVCQRLDRIEKSMSSLYARVVELAAASRRLRGDFTAMGERFDQIEALIRNR